MNDQKLFKYAALLILAPLTLAIFGGDRFRYPCQDPRNWDSEECKMPQCDVTRTCPEHIFKGQRDPRQGPLPDNNAQQSTIQQKPIATGAACK